MRGKRRSIIFPSLLSLCYVAESSVYELRYRSFSKNPRFALASVCKILTSRSNVRSRTYDIATYGLHWPGEREQMRARTLYTTHGNFITERALHVVLPETNERKYFRFAQHLNNFFFYIRITLRHRFIG